ncbi:DUF5677 domain-containing protein [Jatrophihabitans sp. DSM 45814]
MLLDALEEYGVADGDVPGLLVLHGLAMYARDTARAVLALLGGGHTQAAAALTRVVIEHAVLARWLKVDPEARGGLFLQQSAVEEYRWSDVVRAADIEVTDRADGARRGNGRKLKNVAEVFNTVKNLFGGSEPGKQMYLTYRNLSQFVHPSAVTFARYMRTLPRGQLLATKIQVEQDAEAVAYFLVSATTLCALPYLDVLGKADEAALLRASAHANEIPTALD